MGQQTNSIGLYKQNIFIEAGVQTNITAADYIISKIRNVKYVSAIRVRNGAAVATTVTAQNSGGAKITFGTGPSAESLYLFIAGDGV